MAGRQREAVIKGLFNQPRPLRGERELSAAQGRVAVCRASAADGSAALAHCVRGYDKARHSSAQKETSKQYMRKHLLDRLPALTHYDGCTHNDEPIMFRLMDEVEVSEQILNNMDTGHGTHIEIIIHKSLGVVRNGVQRERLIPGEMP